MVKLKFEHLLKLKNQFLLFALLVSLLISCNERTTPVQHSKTANFSDLNYIQVPNSQLFSNIHFLPTEVNTNSDWRDSDFILFLCESTNLIPIERENLQKILPKEEFEDLLQNYCEPRLDSLICQKRYFAFGRIVTDNFVLLNLNIREGNFNDREYTFEFRTYKLDGTFIAKIEYAKWSFDNKVFFGGRLTANMEIELFDHDENVVFKRYSIAEDGEIYLK